LRAKETKQNILGLEDEDTMIRPNASNYLLIDMASCPRLLESSAALL
jgi:hypothetical protein